MRIFEEPSARNRSDTFHLRQSKLFLTHPNNLKAWRVYANKVVWRGYSTLYEGEPTWPKLLIWT